MRRTSVPIRPVDDPILCSPFDEPDQHWLYDTQTGIPSKAPGRRPASYWYKSERSGSAQLSLLAEEERDDLPLVNVLRNDVGRWRKSGWQGASQTTKRLLQHWWSRDRSRRLFFCQLEAVETVIYLRELLARGRSPRWKPHLSLREFEMLTQGINPRPDAWAPEVAQHPRLVDVPVGSHDSKPIERYACKMATGSGKTVVMAMLIAWAFCNRGSTPGDPRFPRSVLVVCPNLTIRERLQVLLPANPHNYYEAFDIVPMQLRPELAKGRVLVINWHRLAPNSETINVGGVPVGQLGRETPEAFARNRLGDLWSEEPLMVLNDEGHHAYRPMSVGRQVALLNRNDIDREDATVWIDGLDRINAACGVEICVDLSATPFYITGSGYTAGSPFPWIVSDFGLVDAIESGITKIPRVPAIDNTGRPDPKYFRLWHNITKDLRGGDGSKSRRLKPEGIYSRAEDALLTLAGQWKQRFEQIEQGTPDQVRTPPVLIVVCDNTDLAQYVYRKISGEVTVSLDSADGPSKLKNKRHRVKQYGRGLPGFEELWNREGAEVTLRIDSKLLEAAENEFSNTTQRDAAERLRRIVSSVGQPGEPGEHIRCVVSVNMLSEGWDANNVTHILGLRAFESQLLCEQVVGRGLRRMDYAPDPETGLLTAEEVDVFGVPFSLIPFKGRGPKPPPPDPPKHEVRALSDRRHFEIRFPNVEGYVMQLRRNRIICDIQSVEPMHLNPEIMPTAAFIRPQVGYQFGVPSTHDGFEYTMVDRREYYDATHPQAIAFEISREIVSRLTDPSAVEEAVPDSDIPTSKKRTVKSLLSGGRAALFPQVLGVVQAYVRERIDFRGLDQREIGLQIYAEEIASRLIAAIMPDESQGEPPILPRLNRYKPVGSTTSVHFKTVLPVHATTASHVNYVACHTKTWEQMAMFHLERMAIDGKVECYVRNHRLGFTIPYELHYDQRAYEPDFIVRLREGDSVLNVVLEIKGFPDADANAKHQAARRWVQAVNNLHRFGIWKFVVCRDPQRLEVDLYFA